MLTCFLKSQWKLNWTFRVDGGSTDPTWITFRWLRKEGTKTYHSLVIRLLPGRCRLAFVGATVFLCLFSNARAEEQRTVILYTSLSGTFRIENIALAEGADAEEAPADT